MTKTIRIGGMSCAHCAARVEKAIGSIAGLKATVNLAANEATVTGDGEIDEKAIERAVEDAGYTLLR